MSDLPEDVLQNWSDPLLKLFLLQRGVSNFSNSHESLVAQAASSVGLSTAPISNTPASVLDLFLLCHLNQYLTRRGHAVNSNAAWSIAAPPGLGREKLDALLDFAKAEYASKIAVDRAARSRFDVEVAETLAMEVKLEDEVDTTVVFPTLLHEDDIEVAYQTWGISLEPSWNRQERLRRLQHAADLFRSTKLSTTGVE